MNRPLKKIVITILTLSLIAAYPASALCESPTPGPTDSAATAESAAPTDSTQPDETATTQPTETPGFQMIKQNDKGSNVIRVQMRLRDLGYFNFRATGKYFSMSESAVRDFQTVNNLDVDGRVGPTTYAKLFSLDDPTASAARKPISPSVASKIISGPPLTGTPAKYGELGDWATINQDPDFKTSSTVTVTDFNTGDSFEMIRTGGTNLAWVEAASLGDNQKFEDCFGGGTNWEKRSVIVTIGGTDYAASLFGNPSGKDVVSDNGMDGHTTLYFNGCTTDVLGFVDKEDWYYMLRAAGEPTDNYRIQF